MAEKTHAAWVAAALLVALLAAAASAARPVSFPPLPQQDEDCTRVGGCTNSFCTQKCSSHEVGTCRIAGEFVYCCCGPLPPAAAAAPTGGAVHPMVN